MDATESKKRIKMDLADQAFAEIDMNSTPCDRLTMEFGGLCVSLGLFDGTHDQFEFLRKYFQPFLISKEQTSSADLQLFLNFLSEPYDKLDHPLWSGEVYSEVRPRDDSFQYYLQRDFVALLHRQEDRVFGFCPEVGASNTVSLDNFFSFCLAQKLLERQRMLLHASGALIDGKAWLFMGPSGVGKSTLCNHLASQGYPILSGDRLYIYRQGDRLMAAPSPISIAGFDRLDPRRSYSNHPVERIFLLEQQNRYFYDDLRPAQVTHAFFRETLCFQPEFINLEDHFKVGAHILNSPQVRWARLSYPQNAPIIEFINRQQQPRVET